MSAWKCSECGTDEERIRSSYKEGGYEEGPPGIFTKPAPPVSIASARIKSRGRVQIADVLVVIGILAVVSLISTHCAGLW